MGDSYEYYRYGKIDPDRWAHLLNRCKGPNRTMDVFAKQCGTNGSRFSRLCNGRSTTPIPEDIVQNIYREQDPEAGVSLEELMEANGMFARKNIQIEERGGLGYQHMNLVQECSCIVGEELGRRCMPGYPMGRKLDRKKDDSHLEMNMMSSFAYQVMGESEYTWNFIIPNMPFSAVNASRMDMRRLRITPTSLFSSCARFFLVDAWEPERLTKVKTSFLVFDREAFEHCCYVLEQIRFNSLISVLLINLGGGRIEDEHQFMCSQEFGKKSIMEIPESEWGDLTNDDKEDWDE